MSVNNIQHVTCPNCGKEREFTLWSQIDAKENPELREALFKNELFSFTCPHCGEEAIISYPFLYQDGDSFRIFFTNDHKVRKDLLESDITTRIVTSRNRLCEKIVIFEAGLDDRVIELLKVLYSHQLQQENPNAVFDSIYYFTGQNGEYSFNFMNEEQPFARINFTRETYENIANVYANLLSENKNEDYLVHLGWAMKKLGAVEE